MLRAIDMRLIPIEAGVPVIGSSALLYFAIRVFRREQILTRWK